MTTQNSSNRGGNRSQGSSRDDKSRSVSASGRNSGSGSGSHSSSRSGSSNRGFAQDHELAVEAGRKGGHASHGGRGRSERDDD